MKLDICDLHMNYREKEALKGLTFSLTPGVYGLLGPNGAGKSTLMNILTGNIKPTGGGVFVNDKDVFSMGKRYRMMLGYVPQQQAVYPSFTAVRFLAYMAALKGMPKKSAREKIPEVLERVELEDVAGQKIKTFSGGMRQRLLIAQAVLNEPDILILDEPTAGLDPKQRVAIRNLISELAENKIVLLATHVVSDVEFISKEFILLKDGKMIKKDTRENLINEINQACFREKGTENIQYVCQDMEDVYLFWLGE